MQTHKKRFVAGLISAIACLQPLSAFADTACTHTSDEKSVYVRSLQTELMVAALTCNASDQYNVFVNRFKPVLARDAKKLQAFFSKLRGKAGADELNAFVTHLANEDSQKSLNMGQANYCDSATKLFTSVLSLNPEDIEDFSTSLPITSTAPVTQCAEATPSVSRAPVEK